MASIKLTDGTMLYNLSVNGDNFIANYEITDEVFMGNLTNVEINIDGNIETHNQMELVQIISYNNQYWFVLRDLTDQELLNINIEAKIEYLAMMTDVDIDI